MKEKVKIFKRYRFRIYPDQEQKDLFERYFGACRFVYNSVLAYKINAYKHGIKYSAYDAIKDFTKIKKLEGYEWLREIDAQVLQQSIFNLDKAFKKFFKEKNVGFPKFKSKKNPIQSFILPQRININFDNKRIRLGKIRWIKYKDKRKFNEKIKNIVVLKNKCNQYFASILVEEDIKQNYKKEILESKIFSADMSCKNFLISQEMLFENQKFYRKDERRLKIRHRKFERKKKNSKNKGKEKLKLAKTYLNITNQRKGYQWNLIHKLVQKFDVFCFEDLNIKGMQQFNSGIAKTISSDFSFSEFLKNLEGKCFKKSKYFIKIDRFFPSSKLCYECGQIKSNLKLFDRKYICDCGYIEDRDINAAKNIKREGIEILKKQKGINLLKNPTGVVPESYAYRNMSVGNELSLGNQNSNNLRN